LAIIKKGEIVENGSLLNLTKLILVMSNYYFRITLELIICIGDVYLGLCVSQA